MFMPEIDIGALGGGDDGEQNGVGFVEISKIFATMQYAFISGTGPNDGV